MIFLRGQLAMKRKPNNLLNNNRYLTLHEENYANRRAERLERNGRNWKWKRARKRIIQEENK